MARISREQYQSAQFITTSLLREKFLRELGVTSIGNQRVCQGADDWEKKIDKYLGVELFSEEPFYTVFSALAKAVGAIRTIREIRKVSGRNPFGSGRLFMVADSAWVIGTKGEGKGSILSPRISMNKPSSDTLGSIAGVKKTADMIIGRANCPLRNEATLVIFDQRRILEVIIISLFPGVINPKLQKDKKLQRDLLGIIFHWRHNVSAGLNIIGGKISEGILKPSDSVLMTFHRMVGVEGEIPANVDEIKERVEGARVKPVGLRIVDFQNNREKPMSVICTPELAWAILGIIPLEQYIALNSG